MFTIRSIIDLVLKSNQIFCKEKINMKTILYFVLFVIPFASYSVCETSFSKKREPFRSYESAQEVVQQKGMTSSNQYYELSKKGELPSDLPSRPDQTYKGKGWRGWGHFLGTGYISTQKRQFKSFEEAQKYVQQLGIKLTHDYRRLSRKGELPKDMPSNPYEVYTGKGWRGWGHFLGTGRVATQTRQVWSFEKAKEYVRAEDIKRSVEYIALSQAGALPPDMPSNPYEVYTGKGWRGWGHFLGTGRVANHEKSFRSYESSQEVVQQKGVVSKKQYNELHKTGEIPFDLPSRPELIYKDKGWRGWGHFLGTSRVANREKSFRSYESSQEVVQQKGVVLKRQYRKLHKTGEIPFDLPSRPDQTYKGKGWRGWKHFLGTEGVVIRRKPFRSYESSQEVVQQKGVVSQKQYRKLHKTGEIPFDLPSSPDQTYKGKGWRGWGQFLGTGYIATQKRQFKSFEEAQKYVQQKGMTSSNQYYELSKKGELPSDLPSNPYEVYTGKGWRGWGHFVGTGYIALQKRQFKSFEEAQKYVQQLGIKLTHDYRRLSRKGELPKDMPSSPDQTYKGKGWRGWKHFLGTVKMMTYTRAQNYVIDELRISTREELYEWLRSGEIPVNFPPEPHKFYSRWTNVRDFLRIQELDKMSYLESKEYIQSFFMQTKVEALKWLVSGDRPDSFPISPREFYGKKWEGWDLYLGLNRDLGLNRVNGTSVNNKAENHQRENGNDGTRLDEVFSSGEKDLFLEDSELNTGYESLIESIGYSFE